MLISESKKYKYGIRKSLKNFNVSYLGIKLTIPLISDIITNIQKELTNADNNIVIVIDDLERKTDKLDIKEIFGFVDSITKAENIKVVLVASTNNFSDVTQKAFIDYSEKSLDRTFEVTRYSKNAPNDILGDDIWKTVKKYL